MKVVSAFTSLMILMSPALFAKDLNVVASFSVLGDMVKVVGGEHVRVVSLVGPNGDPHVFQPSPKDSQALLKADAVFVSGLGMEGWMDRLIEASGFKGEKVVASTNISSRNMVEDGKQITDPHAWNSAKNAATYVSNIMHALIAQDPEDKAYYELRGKAYIAELNALDSWAKNEFAKIPQSKRKVLTSHDAFGYFGKEYGVSFLSPVGFSTESEASANDVAKLIQQMKSEHIKTYFIENQTDPRLVKQIASESGAVSGGELFPEALTTNDGPAGTYVDAFTHNVSAMLNSMK